MDECTLPAGELELRSRPWNTILPDAFMRGESTETTLGGGGGDGDGRRRAGLGAARVGAGVGADAEAATGGCAYGCGCGCGAWGLERTRRMRGRGVGSMESRECRGKSSWSWPDEDDDDESEKREDARERDVSESELSRRRGAAERSDDARPPFRWRRRIFSDLAAELDALDGVDAIAAGEADGDADGDGDGFCGVWTFLSRSSSRHRLEHVGALGENTYGSSAASAAAGCIALTGSGEGVASATSAVSRRSRCCSRSASVAAIFPAAACGRSGSSFPSAKSSSAGSMVADPPRLNSKSMKSLEIAGGSALDAVTAAGSSTTSATAANAAASRAPKDRRGGPSQPKDMDPAAAGPACTLLATAEAMAGGGEAHQMADADSVHSSTVLGYGWGAMKRGEATETGVELR